MLYTGGTTGMPKGVMYDVGAFTAALMLGHPIHGVPVPETAEALIGSRSDARVAKKALSPR